MGVDPVVASQRDVLEMLAGGASETALRQGLADLTRAVDGTAWQADSERFAASILALHSARAADQRRATALTALTDTVTGLATHTDLDGLLQAICRRARQLLGTDVAYIMRADAEQGDWYVHTTEGVVTEPLRTMRIAAGAGIGGRVAQTGRPETTWDYLNDRRIAHDADVDLRVAAEGLHAVAAAPIRQRGVVVGVLFACSRTPYRFEARELALLTALGDHAAVAIEKASLLGDAQAAVADLAEANRRAQAYATRLELLGDARQRLADTALEGGGLRELLGALVRLLPGAVQLLDLEHAVVTEARSTAIVGAQYSTAVAVAAGPELLGELRLTRSDCAGVESEVLTYTAGLIANVLLQRRARSDADLEAASRMLEVLLDGHTDDLEDARRWFGRAGIADRSALVVLVSEPLRRRRWTWLAAARVAADRGGVAAVIAGRLAVVVPGEDPQAEAARWSRSESGAEGLQTIGAATSTTGLDGLPEAYREAGAVVALLLAMDRPGHSASAGQLGVLGHLMGLDGRPDLARLANKALGPLQAGEPGEVDRLLTALTAYFEHGGHLQRTAEALHVHVNTLYRRLEHIDRALGPGWRIGDARLELELALRLKALDQRLDEAEQARNA